MPEISTLGEVIAEAADEFLPASTLPNDSTVSGAKIDNALDALLAAIGAVVYPVTSVYGRLGDVVSALGDYVASQIGNDSSVSGATVKLALEALAAEIAAIPPAPVSTVFGRIGAVVSALNDYVASQIGNDSGVAGLTVKDALNTLSSAVLAVIASLTSHTSNTSNPHSTTKAQVGLTNVTDDAQLKRAANDFASFTHKTTPVSADVIPLEDSAAAGVKKYATLGEAIAFHTSDVANPHAVTKAQVSLSNVTDDAQLKRAANDFASFTHKTTPVTGDVVLIEDSAASGVKKYSTLAEAIAFHTSNVSNPHSVTKAQVGLTSVTDDAQLKRADNDWSGFSTQSGSPAAGDKFLIERASDSAKRVVLAASFNSTYSSRDPIWDRPTTGSADDEEFDVDVLAAGTWSISLTASLGTPMTRDGALDMTQAVASGHYRSSVVGSTLYVQLRQNEEVFMWKTVAAALSSHSLWVLGCGFYHEVGTGLTVDPRMSLQLCKNNAGVPSFADRVFIRTGTSSDRYEVLAVVGGATATNVATNAFSFSLLDGLALRVNHGSAAANNADGFGFRRNGTITTICSANGPQFNANSDKIVIDMQGNTQFTMTGANNTFFALHFLRRLPATGLLAQA